MTKRKIYTIGETVLDILFKDNKPIVATAGGAVLNSSVSLGRLGHPVSLITELGNDQVGKNILEFLKKNNVTVNKINTYKKGKTALALAFLDEDENATYDFYKNYPKKRLSVKMPKFRRNDIVLFGSFFALTKEVRVQLVSFLNEAKKAGAIIIYDPNFREPHKKDLNNLKQYISENINYADIIRGSDEDFRLIFDTYTPDDTINMVNSNGANKFLIYTSGPKRVYFRSNHSSFSLKVPQITPVSTVGAGDNFNAGVIYSIYKLNISRDDLFNLKKQEWEAILDSGITFGTIVCESFDNYIPFEFAKKLNINEPVS